MDNQYPSWVPEWLKSSTGQGISLRVKSAIPLIVFVAGLFHFSTDASVLSNGADQIGVVITATLALISAAYHLYGWARNDVYKKLAAGKFEGMGKQQ